MSGLTFSFERYLRKQAIDRAVLVGKGLAVAGAITAASWIAREAVANYTESSAARLQFQNSAAQNAQVTTPPVAREVHDLGLLVQRPLLGQIESGAPTPPPGPAAKPVSTIPMGLVGVFIQGTKEPYAIIEDKKKNNQEVFKLEEMIFGEAKLKKILSDRVEIERNGQIEQLILDDLSDSGKGDGKGTGSNGSNEFVVDEAELDKALENLPLLLTQARAVPYFKDGVSVGLRLFAIKSDSMFDKIGLRNGDILKAVNGNSLGDITQAMKLFEQLKQERNLTVKLERETEDREFHYQIR